MLTLWIQDKTEYKKITHGEDFKDTIKAALLL